MYLSEQCYNVEEIVTYKLSHNQVFLCIKWEGYPHSENSWEPLDTIYPDIPSTVTDFFTALSFSVNEHTIPMSLKPLKGKRLSR